MKALVMIPAYNEGANIVQLIERMQDVAPNFEYVIIDDCSHDNTRELCKEKGFNIISLPVNLGIGGGVQTGYLYAREYGYDIAVQMDGDGQHDPVYLNDIIAPIINNDADIVIGSRFINNEGFQSSGMRRIGIKFLSWLICCLAGVYVKDVTSGFRAVNKKFINFYADDYAQDYPEPEAIVFAAKLRGRIKEIPVVMKERNSGKSSITFFKSAYYMVKVSMAIIFSSIINTRGGKH